MELKILLLVLLFGIAMIRASRYEDDFDDDPFSPDFMKDFRTKLRASILEDLPRIRKPKRPKLDIEKMEPRPGSYSQGVSVKSSSHQISVNGETVHAGTSEVVLNNNGKVEKWIDGVKVETSDKSSAPVDIYNPLGNRDDSDLSEQKAQAPDPAPTAKLDFLEIEVPKIPKIPDMKFPEIAIPKIPNIEFPKLAIPKIPDIKFPKLAIPKIPDITFPNIAIPKIPDIQFPNIAIPKIPDISFPNIPDIKVPKIKIPKNYIFNTEQGKQHHQSLNTVSYFSCSDVNGVKTSDSSSAVLINNNGKVEQWINGVKQ